MNSLKKSKTGGLLKAQEKKEVQGWITAACTSIKQVTSTYQLEQISNRISFFTQFVQGRLDFFLGKVTQW
jgi:hypothetical protein